MLFFTFNIIDSVFCEESGLLLNLHRVVNFTLMSRLSFDDLQLTRGLVAANAKITLQTGYFQVICPVLVSFVLFGIAVHQTEMSFMKKGWDFFVKYSFVIH